MRFALLFFGIGLPVAAMANGATGLGLEMFDRAPWTSGILVDPAYGTVAVVRDSAKLGY